MKNVLEAAALSVGFGCAVAGGAGCGSAKAPPPTTLSRDELLDPTTCDKCHADHFRDWSGSMHAYAADDPVFLAMNARGQRETNGALGPFCVNCHAPMAVRDGKTTDGLNLATVEPKYKGITCFFCHTVDAVLGDHNDELHLASDTVMRGPFSNPVANTAHTAGYSGLHDRDHLESAQLCGACHDVVTPSGVAIERTFDEWKNHTVFSQSPGGDTCGQCHMHQSGTPVPVAQAPGVSPRPYHAHDFPGVDIALTPFAQADTQMESVRTFVDTTIQSSLCVGEGTAGITVILDNVAAGHGFPSGSAQDRRAWVEVIAYSGMNVIYQSGFVQDGTAVTTINDPDLWLLRDCLLDSKNNPVPMFWQAQNPSESYQLPGSLTFDPSSPDFYRTHIFQTFPRQTALPAAPDRVTMRVRLQPIGLDVLDDLTTSGDLKDPTVRANMPTYDVGNNPVVTWTPATAAPGGVFNNIPYSCVSNTSASFIPQVPAPAHVYCKP
jgi:hypothetical protein